MCALATPNDPYALELLFVDEEGDKIEAIMQKHYMHRFTNHVVEGHVYKVTNFTVSRNGGKFRTVDQSEVDIQNLMNASKIWWNPAIPEAISFKDRYKVKVVVSDGIESAPLIMFDSECSYLLKRQCKDLVAENKGKNKDAYPDEILSLVGSELLFRVERKEDNFFLYDECYIVRKICTDSSLINEFKEIVDDDTPLNAKGKSCVIDLSPQCNSIASEVDATPPSSGQCSLSAASMIVCSKRGPSDGDDPPSNKKMRTKLRGVKVERG
ncbi:Nucleic acid-binding, OB-fold [Sesbania bispinosa]|nr:Nucleic acid-binding, OB-fold [Sesbania bispinosa]